MEAKYPPGTEAGREHVCRGMTDEAPGVKPGDLIFVAREAPGHPRFKRKGPHLLFEAEIPLRDALCGGRLDIVHLDSRVVRVEFEGVVNHGETRRIPEEGMPREDNASVGGDLYVRFRVKMPESLDDETRALLSSRLPEGPPGGQGAYAREPERCEMFKFSGECPAFA